MSRRPLVAVLRPDYGVHGGFERHLETVMAGLTDRGWGVQPIRLDATTPRSNLLGLPIRPVQHEFHDDYFKYLSLVVQTAELDLAGFDLVLSTQPPTYLARHRRKVALFYHQARQFYDLSEAYVRSGFAEAEIHDAAVASVRSIDKAGVGDVRHWLAGSATTAARLQRYWAIPEDRISLYSAPPACELPNDAPPYTPDGPILHVGRMEWPKRPELVVDAIHRLRSGRQAEFVGGGSREDFVRSIDVELHRTGPGTDLPDRRTWLNRGIYTSGWRPDPGPQSGRIHFTGPQSDAGRDAAYRAASAVVAPAHNEDYGLTALEAMSFARPVVVCRDGGGLTELVEHGVNGLVVDGTATALAAALDWLIENPERAAALGRAGFQRVATITEDRALSHVEQALEKALAG